MSDSARSASSPRAILRLALPAFGVLAAEPLYLLYDLAVVGRLGALALAGFAVGGLVLAQVSTQLTFLSYGTTARSARWFGAGDRARAVGEGVQATWLALGVGLLFVVVVEVVAGPVCGVIAGRPEIAGEAERWLRIAVLGVPAILITMAGNGWLRGVRELARPFGFIVAGLGLSTVLCPVLVHGLVGAPAWGLVGSAVANVIGQIVAAGLFLVTLRRERVPVRPRPTVLRAQLVMGRDLVARSLAFQVCFVSAGAVAARFGAAAVAGHQIVLQLWTFVALVLDSLAISAQTLVGAALGAGDRAEARATALRVTCWSTGCAVLLAVGFAAAARVLPTWFTHDDAVLAQVASIWWFFVALVPAGGVVFALDGVLLGAGDAAYLRSTTLAAALLGFLPVIWGALIFGWGLPGIWSGLAAFILLRLVAVTVRAVSGRWAVVGVAG